MSDILQNILESNINIPVIYDTDYRGGINDKGEINQLWGEEALNNAIKMWIASFKGEILREPGRAGYITKWLLKPMTEINVDDVEMAIRDGIDQDFFPVLDILHLSVIPNYEKRYWELYLEVYSKDLKVRTVVSEKIKGRV